MLDAHMSISNKFVHPTIDIVKIAAVRRKIWMSLKRLLMFTSVSEKYYSLEERKRKSDEWR